MRPMHLSPVRSPQLRQNPSRAKLGLSKGLPLVALGVGNRQPQFERIDSPAEQADRCRVDRIVARPDPGIDQRFLASVDPGQPSAFGAAGLVLPPRP